MSEKSLSQKHHLVLKPVDQLGSSSKSKKDRRAMNTTEQLKRIKNINPGNENKLGNRNVYNVHLNLGKSNHRKINRLGICYVKVVEIQVLKA